MKPLRDYYEFLLLYFVFNNESPQQQGRNQLFLVVTAQLQLLCTSVFHGYLKLSTGERIVLYMSLQGLRVHQFSI